MTDKKEGVRSIVSQKRKKKKKKIKRNEKERILKKRCTKGLEYIYPRPPVIPWQWGCKQWCLDEFYSNIHPFLSSPRFPPLFVSHYGVSSCGAMNEKKNHRSNNTYPGRVGTNCGTGLSLDSAATAACTAIGGGNAAASLCARTGATRRRPWAPGCPTPPRARYS